MGAHLPLKSGRYVVFESEAKNLLPRNSLIPGNLYLRDLRTDYIRIVSAGHGNTRAYGRSDQAALSARGTYLVFVSTATNLLPTQSPAVHAVYLRNLRTQRTWRVAPGWDDPALSGDGVVVAFATGANIVDEDTNEQEDVYAWNRITQQSVRLNLRPDGSQSTLNPWQSPAPSISDDGRFVVFP